MRQNLKKRRAAAALRGTAETLDDELIDEERTHENAFADLTDRQNRESDSLTHTTCLQVLKTQAHLFLMPCAHSAEFRYSY